MRHEQTVDTTARVHERNAVIGRTAFPNGASRFVHEGFGADQGDLTRVHPALQGSIVVEEVDGVPHVAQTSTTEASSVDRPTVVVRISPRYRVVERAGIA